MTKSVKEINELLKATRDQKFRKMSQAKLDANTSRSAVLSGTKRSTDAIEKLKSNEEWRKNVDEANKRITKDPKRNKAIGDALRGKTRPPEVGEAISKSLTGKKLTVEHRAKMSEIRKGKSINKVLPIICCPHCGKEGKELIMRRWHFDNCKHK